MPPPRHTTPSRLAPHASGLVLALALATGLAGCRPHVSGNGVLLKADCNAGTFDAVKLGLGLDATITVDPLASGVTCVLSGDANLVPNITMTAPGGVLQASDAPDFDRILPLKLVITAPALHAVEASDAGAPEGDSTRVTVGNAATQALTVAGHDGAQITVTGPGAAGGTATVTLGQSAIFFGFGYPVASASVALTDQGHAQLEVAGAVSGSASGQSAVELQGSGTCAVTLAGAATCSVRP